MVVFSRSVVLGWGAGWGVPFGGGDLVPLASPLSSVGDQAPVSFDFTADPDGPLPGSWNYFIFADDGSGLKTVSPESDSLSFFRVTEGLGFWRYDRSPSIPSSTFIEQGLAASPTGILQGRSADISIAFVEPPRLLDARADEFVFEVVLGYRSSDAANFYGARARAHWAGGVWDVPAVLELVQFIRGEPTVLAAPDMPPTNASTDFWDAYKYGGLEIILRDRQLTGILNGVVTGVVTIPLVGGGDPIVLVRAYNRTGAVIVPVPAIAGLQLQTLRDLEALGPGQQVVGDSELDAPIEPAYKLPLQDLVDKGFIRRKGARIWEVLQDVDANVYGTPVGLRVGNLLRAVEPFTSQDVVAVVFDLAYTRGLSERT